GVNGGHQSKMTPTKLLLLFRRAGLYSFGRRRVGGRSRSHVFHGAWLAQRFDLDSLLATAICPNYLATKDQAVLFDGHELAVKERLPGIDHVREFDRSRFHH